MKKRVALLLSLIMLVSLMFPAGIYAAESDNGLENALKAAKSIFTIPAEYTEFNYNVNMDGSRKIWYLNWNSKDSAEGNMSISVDDHGTIISYYNYKWSDYSQRKFPKFSRQDALKKSGDFLKKVNPEAFGNVKLVEDYQRTYMNSDYNFNYIRLVNGIPMPDNSIYITVSSNTGEVLNYNYNWTDDLVFPAADKAISLAAAQQAYIDKMGLRLVYNQTSDADNVKSYAAYVPKYDSTYYIDALTGDRTQLNPYWYGYGGGGAGGMGMYDKKMEQTSQAATNLSPQEIKAIEEVSKLITQEDAEKKARAFTELGLTSDFKVTNAGLSRDWLIKTSFTWNLNFSKEGADPGKEVTYINVSIDAVTGEIKSFYRSFPYNESDAVKYDAAQSKAAVEAFLQGLVPDKFSQTVYEEVANDYYLKAIGKIPQRQYNFTYTRKVNGIPFTANNITVGFDAVYGKIVNFNASWYDLDFPSIDKAISLDSVYTSMFSSIGLELQYRLKYPEASQEKMPIRKPDTKPEPVLVYAVKQGKPLSFDANTGAIIDYNGQPYKEIKPVEYTDISASFAEKEISALAQYGISLEGSEFKPSQEIKQADFFRLLSKTLNYYAPSDPAKEVDEMYKFLSREGVVKDGDKAPDAGVTREDAVKFIVRALKFDRVADIKGIYKCSFKDLEKINPDLIGYVAIAQGLNIIKGYQDSNFNPKGAVTRAQAAVMIYNYLQK